MATYLITLQPSGWRFPAEAGHTLLASALAAGIELPSSCRNGTCRTCLCRIDAGQARFLIDWPGVSADERREGMTLPCVAAPAADLSLWAPGARRLA